METRFTGGQTARARLAQIQNIRVRTAGRARWDAISQIRFKLINTGQRNARIISGKLVLRRFDCRKISGTFPALAVGNSLGYANGNTSRNESANHQDDEDLKERECLLTFILPYPFVRHLPYPSLQIVLALN